MAIFSLFLLLLALGVAALGVSRPWEDDSVGPELTLSPGIGMALGDSVVVTPARPLKLARSRGADVGRSAVVAASTPRVRDRTSRAVAVGVAAARPVARVVTASAPPRSPEPQPAEPPAPEAIAPTPPAPAPLPVAATVPAPQPAAGSDEGSPGRPVGVDDDAVCGTGLELYEDCEYAFAFSFYVEPTPYGEAGVEVPLAQIVDEANESVGLGLRLAAYPGEEWQGGGRGLWAGGAAAGGDRLLTPVQEGLWHQAVLHFEVSSEGEGFYEVYLDGRPVDVRSGVSLLAPGSGVARIEVGPGGTLESVLP